MRKRSKLDVEWYLPGHKRPFTYSTVATSDLIVLLCEETVSHTPSEILPLIHYDADAKRIINEYIKRGFESYPLNIK